MSRLLYPVLYALCFAAEIGARRVLFACGTVDSISYRECALAARAAARSGAASWRRDPLTGEE